MSQVRYTHKFVCKDVSREANEYVAHYECEDCGHMLNYHQQFDGNPPAFDEVVNRDSDAPCVEEILRRASADDDEYIGSEDLHKIISQNSLIIERERALNEFFFSKESA